LEQALEADDGTLLVVSHDRYLLERVAGRLLLVESGQVRNAPGGVSLRAADEPVA
jgi:ATPase subunit of ABC transporter with duplicated ATPase domains